MDDLPSMDGSAGVSAPYCDPYKFTRQIQTGECTMNVLLEARDQEGCGEFALTLEDFENGLQVQVEAQCQQLATLHREAAALRATVREQAADLVAVQARLEAEQAGAAEARRLIDTLQAEGRGLADRLRAGEAEQRRLAAQLAQEAEANDAAQRRVRESELRNTELLLQVSEGERKVAALEAQVAQLQDTVEDQERRLQRMGSEVMDGEMQLSEALARVEDGRGTAQQLRNELTQAQAVSQERRKHVAALEAELAATQQRQKRAEAREAELEATLQAERTLKQELQDRVKGLDKEKAELDTKYSGLLSQHESVVRERGVLVREGREVRAGLQHLLTVNRRIAETVATRHSVLKKEDRDGVLTDWVVMGGPQGGASLTDPLPAALKREVARLEELQRYEEGLSLLRSEELAKAQGLERRLWQRDEAYHREVLRANEVEVWHHLVAMEGRERWSITRFLLGKRDSRASVLSSWELTPRDAPPSDPDHPQRRCRTPTVPRGRQCDDLLPRAGPVVLQLALPQPLLAKPSAFKPPERPPLGRAPTASPPGPPATPAAAALAPTTVCDPAARPAAARRPPPLHGPTTGRPNPIAVERPNPTLSPRPSARSPTAPSASAPPPVPRSHSPTPARSPVPDAAATPRGPALPPAASPNRPGPALAAPGVSSQRGVPPSGLSSSSPSASSPSPSVDLPASRGKGAGLGRPPPSPRLSPTAISHSSPPATGLPPSPDSGLTAEEDSEAITSRRLFPAHPATTPLVVASQPLLAEPLSPHAAASPGPARSPSPPATPLAPPTPPEPPATSKPGKSPDAPAAPKNSTTRPTTKGPQGPAELRRSPARPRLPLAAVSNVPQVRP